MTKSRRGRPAAVPAEPELITVNEAATMLQRKPTTVRRLIRLKQLEARIVFFKVRVVKKSVERLLRPRPYKPQKPAPPRHRPVYGPQQNMWESIGVGATS